MQGDFTLNPLAIDPNVTRVLMQQGRVLLSSDWNELVAVMVGQVRRLAEDLIGPHGGEEDAFEISVVDNRIRIGFGTYYVEGLRFNNLIETEEETLPWSKQPSFTTTDDPPKVSGIFYAEVWERHVSASEESWMREIALGGPDTTSRAAIVWQVKFLPLDKKPARVNGYTVLQAILRSHNRLRARAKFDAGETEPCTISPEAQFRGAENQLYRVEIHDVERVENGQNIPATFKWSRDNASTVFAIENLNGDTVQLAFLGNDRRTSLAPGDWVEIVDDDVINMPPTDAKATPLSRIKSVDRTTSTVRLEQTPTGPAGTVRKKRPILRKWDAAPQEVVEGEGDTGWIDLENGVQIQFDLQKGLPPDRRHWRIGDYWLIPARTISGDVIWPREQDEKTPTFLVPFGRHRFAPLAWWDGTGVDPDLRMIIKPIAK